MQIEVLFFLPSHKKPQWLRSTRPFQIQLNIDIYYANRSQINTSFVGVIIPEKLVHNIYKTNKNTTLKKTEQKNCPSEHQKQAQATIALHVP